MVRRGKGLKSGPVSVILITRKWREAGRVRGERGLGARGTTSFNVILGQGDDTTFGLQHIMSITTPRILHDCKGEKNRISRSITLAVKSAGQKILKLTRINRRGNSSHLNGNRLPL